MSGTAGKGSETTGSANCGISRIGVVGGGLIGSGIAETCARAGLEVLVRVSSGKSEAASRRRLTASLGKAVEKKRLTVRESSTLVERISYTTDIGDLHDRQIVIEAVQEHEPTKVAIFQALDKVVADPTAILASATSSISITRLGSVTGRGKHVLGMHFLNPVPVIPLVELVEGLTTDRESMDRAELFVVKVLGKRIIRARDRAGFLINGLLVPFLLAAIRMVESGDATAETVDEGMVYGCAHPMGPLRLVDLIGLDIIAGVADALYAEFREPLYAAPGLLSRMIDVGHIGKKAGRGFYVYDNWPEATYGS